MNTLLLFRQSGNRGNVTVINRATKATNTLTDSKAVTPDAIAANSVTNTIYVANSDNDITVIDGANE